MLQDRKACERTRFLAGFIISALGQEAFMSGSFPCILVLKHTREIYL